MRGLARWAVPTLVLVQACGGGGGGDVVNPPAAVASVSVTLAASQVFIGQTSQGTAVVRDAQNNVLTGRAVTWSSSNTAVATVASSSGLVTGVTAGSATISATSEGKTGQADITVAVDPATQPQIQNLTITQNGQAANLSQVVGTLSLAFQLQVPNGYTGTLVVKVDTVEFLRETISAPALAARVLPGTTAAPSVLVERNVALNTASTVTTLTSESVREIPLISNRDVAAVVQLVPAVAGGPGVQQSVNLRTANPSYARGWLRINGATATGSDGLTYGGSPIDAAVSIAAFDNEVINGFEVAVVPAQAEYGRSTNGVVNTITRIPRTDFNFFQINNLNIEQADLTMILTRITRNGQDINPQLEYFGNAAYTTDLIGSGFANTAQQVVGRTPPAGKQYFQVAHTQFSPWSTGNIRVRAAIDPFHIDEVGPQKSPAAVDPVYSYLDRRLNVGFSAYWPGEKYGANNSQLSLGYDLSDNFRIGSLTDKTGVVENQTRYYAGPISNLANLYTPQYLVNSALDLPESSGARLYASGVRAFDGRGNGSNFMLQTSIQNPWNIQGQQSIGAQIGVDQAAFGFTKLFANLNVTGIPDESTWNSTSIDPAIGWNFTASNSAVGLPNNWLSARGSINTMWGFGAGMAMDEFEILPSSGGTSGGTATVAVKTFTDRTSPTPPVTQGLWEFQFKGADNSGRFLQNLQWPLQKRFLLDYTPPTNAQINYSQTVVPGALNSATLLGTDNWGISRLRIGLRYDYSAGVTGGQIYTPLAEFSLPGSLTGSRVTNLNTTVAGMVSIGFWFFNQFNGIVDWGNLHRSNGATLELMDYAWNWSAVHFAPFNNTAPAPTLPNVSDVRASIGSTNWCPGTCQAGGNRFVSLNFNYFDDRAMGDPTISKSEWFAIPSTGRVQLLGRQATPTIVPEGLGRRISYNLNLDLASYCGPGGSALVFPIGYATDGKSSLKAGSFFSATIQSPIRYTNQCNQPPPPLPPPPPP